MKLIDKPIRGKTKEAYRRAFENLFFNPCFHSCSEIVFRDGYYIANVKFKVNDND